MSEKYSCLIWWANVFSWQPRSVLPLYGDWDTNHCFYTPCGDYTQFTTASTHRVWTIGHLPPFLHNVCGLLAIYHCFSTLMEDNSLGLHNSNTICWEVLQLLQVVRIGWPRGSGRPLRSPQRPSAAHQITRKSLNFAQV